MSNTDESANFTDTDANNSGINTSKTTGNIALNSFREKNTTKDTSGNKYYTSRRSLSNDRKNSRKFSGRIYGDTDSSSMRNTLTRDRKNSNDINTSFEISTFSFLRTSFRRKRKLSK
jgi:hypothetical protein